MIETTVRQLLHEAVEDHEPPFTRDLVAGAVRGARRSRRRHIAAGISVAVAAGPALAFGMPALAGALSPAAQSHQQGAAPAAAGSNSAHPGVTVSPAGSPGVLFIRPTQPPQRAEAHPVPITSQSLGQLLIDDLPADSTFGEVEASTDANPGATLRSADAWFNNVSTPAGSGTVQVSLLAAGQQAFDFGCPAATAAGVSCQVYHLPGGAEVAEEYSGGPNGKTPAQVSVSVFRPNVAQVNVTESNSAMVPPNPVSKGEPLTLSQLLRLALDPRWRFTIGQSFVQHASNLPVAPLNTSGS
ncbi:MAG TPA: hypothetical protein VGI58_15470 [Streptosporangiaceae bacterium]|jgi:hypothetical protein